MKKKIALFGSTGSVGQNTLEVVRANSDLFEIVALAANSNLVLLESDIKEFNPKIVCLYNEDKAKILKNKFPNITVVFGVHGLKTLAAYQEVELCLLAMSGNLGIHVAIEAIKAKKTIALANKEILVSAGEFIMPLVKKNNIELLTVDSEHSAIFQCLKNEDMKTVKRIILTASGGPFKDLSIEELEKVTLQDALKHNYKMGKKITIDCSTLMNKGLEVIEAHYLFDMELDKIDVIIHPQSIIHSFVEFIDGSMLAQMSEPNMQIPIQYALTYPKRIASNIKNFDFIKNSHLTFFAPDLKKFRCLYLAKEALKIKKSMPCFMNSANEVLVERYLKGEITWSEIAKKLEKLMSSHKVQNMVDLDTVFEIDKLAKEQAKNI
ncbi:MAG: 1-deoxy-D-xylulose-5-phosphate reductoisomerase [Chlamydiae bacterium]|nr:1-deoxy-D-xylulose-5-phosphate reductoisomerase [Chlamydiota bacterium]